MRRSAEYELYIEITIERAAQHTGHLLEYLVELIGFAEVAFAQSSPLEFLEILLDPTLASAESGKY